MSAIQRLSGLDGNLRQLKIAPDANDWFGWATAGIGDLNQDEIPDVAIGAPGANALYLIYLAHNGTAKGALRINDGSKSGLDFSTSFFPLTPTDYFGCSVASIGDLDGDGFSDLVVGAFGDGVNGTSFLEPGTQSGAAYVLLMGPFGTVRNATRLYSPGETAEKGARFGWAVASAGDLNGDNVTDLAIGAPGVLGGEGAVYLTFLNASGWPLSESSNGQPQFAVLSSRSGLLPPSVQLSLKNSTSAFGSSLAIVSDLNQDGIPDLAVGAYGDDGTNDNGTIPLDSSGAVYLLMLQAEATTGALVNATSESGVKIDASTVQSMGHRLQSEDHFGWSLVGLGNIDGDYGVELAVGSPRDDDLLPQSGAVYMVFLDRAEPFNRGGAGGFTDGAVLSMVKLSNEAYYKRDNKQVGLYPLTYSLPGQEAYNRRLQQRRHLAQVTPAPTTSSYPTAPPTVPPAPVPTSTVLPTAPPSVPPTSAPTNSLRPTVAPTLQPTPWPTPTPSINAFILNAGGDYFGCSVARLGDVSGDTVGDLAVGAYGVDDRGSKGGSAYVMALTAVDCTETDFGGVLSTPTELPSPAPSQPTLAPTQAPSVLPARRRLTKTKTPPRKARTLLVWQEEWEGHKGGPGGGEDDDWCDLVLGDVNNDCAFDVEDLQYMAWYHVNGGPDAARTSRSGDDDDTVSGYTSSLDLTFSDGPKQLASLDPDLDGQNATLADLAFLSQVLAKKYRFLRQIDITPLPYAIQVELAKTGNINTLRVSSSFTRPVPHFLFHGALCSLLLAAPSYSLYFLSIEISFPYQVAQATDGRHLLPLKTPKSPSKWARSPTRITLCLKWEVRQISSIRTMAGELENQRSMAWWCKRLRPARVHGGLPHSVILTVRKMSG